jgi:hypothetical protein
LRRGFAARGGCQGLGENVGGAAGSVVGSELSCGCGMQGCKESGSEVMDDMGVKEV